jgi:glycosyltransferase involved in cell wall biosynthesis
LPTRNRWPILSAHALPSALGQEDVELEVVVVDDASGDETAAKLRELRDPRVRVVRNDERRGASAARNTGIGAARSEWLAFLDDDDLWAPTKLRRQLDAAAAASAGWAYAGSIVIDGRGRPLQLEAVPAPSGLALALGRSNVVPSPDSNVVARTELVRRVGGFDQSLTNFEDWDFLIRLAGSSCAAACPEVLLARVDHPRRPLPPPRLALRQLELMLTRHRRLEPGDRRSALEWLATENVRTCRRLMGAGLYARAAISYRSPGNLVAAFGALYGESGLRIVSRFLSAARGNSHVATREAPTSTPDWLSRFRVSVR